LLGTRKAGKKRKKKKDGESMKKCGSEVRKKMVVVRLNDGEYQKLQSLQQRTTERSLSAYLRKLALNRPVTVKVRNASADDFLRELLPLRAMLTEAANTYTTAVKRLQLLQKIPEFRSWLMLHEASRSSLVDKISRIESLTTQLYEQWLRK
jgi:hypothetical protein